jgi:hypothetical protein
VHTPHEHSGRTHRRDNGEFHSVTFGGSFSTFFYLGPVNTTRTYATTQEANVKFSLLIEVPDSRYEVLFDLDNPDAAAERVAEILADVEKRFTKKRARPAASAPKAPVTVPPGGAK